LSERGGWSEAYANMGIMNWYFAQYSCGTYGSEFYGDNAAACATTTSTPNQSNLTNTGTPIGIGGGLALLILALALFIKTRKKK